MVDAEQVGGQQVRRELHAGEVQPQRRGERPGDQRLAEAGQVLDQHVPAGEHGGEDQRQRFALAHHGALDLVEDGFAVGGRGRDGHRHRRSRRSMISVNVAAPDPFPGRRCARFVGINPRPQLVTEQDAAGGLERTGDFWPLVALSRARTAGPVWAAAAGPNPTEWCRTTRSGIWSAPPTDSVPILVVGRSVGWLGLRATRK